MKESAIVLAAVLALAACSSEDGCPRVKEPGASPAQQILLDPKAEPFRAEAPDTFTVVFRTSAGDVTVEVYRDWAPLGAQRFYNLARNGFYDGTRFFRVLPGFVVQFGVSGVPAIQRAWNEAPLRDDPVTHSNERGTLTFATAGPDTRTTQLFFNYGNNDNLDGAGFAPIGRVVDGSAVLLRLYSGYGEFAPQGNGPDFGCMLSGGNAYLERSFERLDSIASATIMEH
jgi:peptidyl-prolyl cis-trans isomerase A (cyclophilin A)